MIHTTIETTQNKETKTGIYKCASNGEFVLIHGITSKTYKTERGALSKWNKLVAKGLV